MLAPAWCWATISCLFPPPSGPNPERREPSVALEAFQRFEPDKPAGSSRWERLCRDLPGLKFREFAKEAATQGEALPCHVFFPEF